jgi:secondary thiamine-phosphate synthase enzyme
MSKQSVVTARDLPVRDVSTSVGGITVHAETIVVETGQRIEVIDLTDRIMAQVRGRGVSEGLLSLFPLHTTCAVFINEAQTALVADIKRFLEQVVARDAAWLHNNPDYSDCDRMNADAHLRALLLGHGLTLQVSGGELVLGQWQRILLGEMDGPRARSLRLQLMGVA